MAQLGGTYVADPTAPKVSFEPAPAGVYMAQIVASEVKVTNDGTGQYIELTWEIMQGEYMGKKIFDRINHHSQSEKARVFAARRLNDLQVALGVNALTDTEQLHLKPGMLKIKVAPAGRTQEGKDYDAKNEFVSISPFVHGSTAPTMQQAPQQQSLPNTNAPQTAQASNPVSNAAPQNGQRTPWGGGQ